MDKFEIRNLKSQRDFGLVQVFRQLKSRGSDLPEGPRSLPRACACAGVLWLVLLSSGCGQPSANTPAAARPADSRAEGTASKGEDKTAGRPLANVPTGFAPARIGILPLTELTRSGNSGQAAVLTIYVDFLDAFGSHIKAPGVLRFELYDYVPRSAEPKGQRIAVWPDIDVTNPAENNRYWQDFLRAYEFTLDAPAGLDKTYILEATCICPDGRRLSTQAPLRAARQPAS